jgi:dipeptidase D
MKQIAESLGFECAVGEGYPGWEYVKDSKVRDICVRKYRELFGKDPEVGAIHAGLECGLLMEKIEGLDAVSMGPDMYDVHTPNEHIDINSIGNTYNLLCKILEEIS